MLSEANPFLAPASIVVAPFIGSFISVVVLRGSEGRPVIVGRSMCDHCGRALRAIELVPLVSYAVLRGRCASCHAIIDPLHPVLEILAVAVAISAALNTAGWILFASLVLGWTLLTLGAIDWRTGFLPDRLTIPLALAGLAVAYALDPQSLLDHMLGAGAGFMSFAGLSWIYRRLRGRDGLGMGDAKLLAAGGAWLSWEGLPTTVLFAAVIGLVIVLTQLRSGRRIDGAARIPFGPALAAAIWMVWLFGPLVPSGV